MLRSFLQAIAAVLLGIFSVLLTLAAFYILAALFFLTWWASVEYVGFSMLLGLVTSIAVMSTMILTVLIYGDIIEEPF